jgi:VWFA-related protein
MLEAKSGGGGSIRDPRFKAVLILVAGLAQAAGVSAPIAAGLPSQDQIPGLKPLRHEVSVTLKLLQVYVSGRDGRPARGLTREDFIVRDDGELRTVTDFEEHNLTPVPVEAKVLETPLPAPRLLGRKFLFFFDYGYNDSQGIRKCARIALNFLESKLGPLDEVGVATFSGLKRLQFPLLFTGDLKKARDLISRIGAFESSGRIEEHEDQYQRGLKEGAFADARPEGKTTWNLPTATGYNPEMEERHLIRMYLDGLMSLARALRYESGQKNLVFFSYGPSYRSIWRGDQVSLDAKGRPPDQFAEIRNKAEALLKELATSNVAVFAMNTSGLSAVPENIRAGILGRMAQMTGGSYWGNIDNAAPFVEMVQSQTGSYYVLGYPVDEKWDGRYHRIKVEVRKPGLSVRTQAGYFGPKMFADYTEEERRMHLVDLALAETPLYQTPRRFAMAAVPIGLGGGGGLRLAASIPLQEIRDAAGERTEITALAFNRVDEIAAEQRLVQNFMPRSEGAAAVLADMILPPGEYRCRIVIRNLGSGQSAVAGVTAKVPEALAAGIRILPPSFLRPERDPFLLKLEPLPQKSAAGSSQLPEAPGPLFDPSQYGPLLGTVLHAGTEVAAEIHVAAAGAAEARVKIDAFLFDRLNAERIPLGLAILARRDGAAGAAFFVRLSVPDVEPDVYVLVITAEDQRSGAKTDIRRDFSIEKLPAHPAEGGAR